MGVNNSGRNLALGGLTGAITHVGAHSAFPGSSGASELSGGSYARQALTWGAASAGAQNITNTPAIPIPAGSDVAWLGYWSALTSGTCHACAPAGGFDPFEFVCDLTTNVITAFGHGLSDGQTVVFHGGTPPAPLVEGTIYFVRDATTNTLAVAATSGGAAIDLTAQAAAACALQRIAVQNFATAGTYGLTTATQISLNF